MDLLAPTMRRKKNTLSMFRSLALWLLPFGATSANFFAFWLDRLEPSFFPALMKCLPVLSLAFSVIIHNVSHGGPTAYAWKIVLGLLLSAAGDACLIWPDLFLHGLLLFGFAHLLYILAFGLRPFKLFLFLPLAVFGGAFYAFLYPYLQGQMVYMVAAYGALIVTMAGRALTWACHSPYGRSWARISSAVGAIIFMASDTILAVDKFCFPLPHSNLLIIGTYYLAQLLIALSVVQSTSIDELWKIE